MAFLAPKFSKPVAYGNLVKNFQSLVAHGFPGDQRRFYDEVCFGCFWSPKQTFCAITFINALILSDNLRFYDIPPQSAARSISTVCVLFFGSLISENIVPQRSPAIMSEKIPKAMAEKFTAITTLIDAFCEKHLNEEYRQMIHRVVGALARKRPSPLLRGKENVWAAAAVHAVGRVNFLDDPSQSPHCKPRVIYEHFGIGESTGQNKSKEIRDLLKMGQFSPEWTLPSRLADNPLAWMVQLNGLIVDIRGLPIELQQMAFDKGLIPYVPAEKATSA